MKNIFNSIPFLVTGTVLYILYVWFFCLGVGFGRFFEIDWLIFSKLLLFLFPVYIWLIYKSESFYFSDLFLILSPVFLWLLISIFISGKSGSNFYLIEPEFVLALSGIYLLKNPLIKLFGFIPEICVKFGLVSVLWILVVLVFKFVPIHRS